MIQGRADGMQASHVWVDFEERPGGICFFFFFDFKSALLLLLNSPGKQCTPYCLWEDGCSHWPFSFGEALDVTICDQGTLKIGH